MQNERCIYLKSLIDHNSCAILTQCKCNHSEPCSFYASNNVYGFEIGTEIPYPLDKLKVVTDGDVKYGFVKNRYEVRGGVKDAGT